jgi:class 3 adenylate cyclase
VVEVQPPPEGKERRLVTVVFADLIGSTALGERLDPEALRDVLDTYFATMRGAIEAEGGTVEKFIGDAVVAAFGTPVAHEDDPARALRAALGMRARLDALNAELVAARDLTLQMRIGINTGEVLATINPAPGEPMVTGDAVNVAARLEQVAEPGQVVVAERTARAARTFRFRELGSLDLRGKERAVDAVLLVEERPGAARRGIPGLDTPFVGRGRELELLRALLDRVTDERRPHLVTIYGEPGVGKSRLVKEFLDEAVERTPGLAVLRGRCLPYGDGITWWPLAEILKTHAGILDTDPAATVLAKTRGACDAIACGDVETCAALAYTVGVEDPSAPMPTDPRRVRADMHAAWRGFFTSLAGTTPVVVVVEDVHWADGSLLDLLEDVAARSEGPVLFVCPSRPELADRRPTWGGGRRNATNVGLDPLSSEDADELIGLLLSIEDIPERTHRRILERAEGNPFFLEEIVRHLIDEGQIVRRDGAWHATDALGDVRIPDTVQGVLAARIDLLDIAERRALQLAAVVGRVFWPSPVGILLNGERERLDEILGLLEDRDLVRSRVGSSLAGEPEFIFKHVLTRDVAYETLPRRDRARAHAAIAEWMEGLAAGRSGEFVELLAYHALEAYRGALDDPSTDPGALDVQRARAFRNVLDAAEQARRRFAMEKALRLIRQAEAIASGPIERATALERLGIAAINSYQGDLAWRSLREAADLRIEHAPDDRAAIARVCATAVEPPSRWPGSMREVPSEEEIIRYIDEGLAYADVEDEPLVRLLTARAFAPFSFGAGRELRADEYEACREDGRRAAEMAMGIGRPDLASAALDAMGSAGITLGLYGPNLDIIERRIELAEILDDPWEVGDIFAMGAWFATNLGDFDRAAELAAEGIRRLGEVDAAVGIHIHNLCWLALARFSKGDWAAVVEDVLPEVLRLLGDRREQAPYFTAPLLGPAAFVKSARRDDDAGWLVDLIGHMGRDGHNRQIALSAWWAWIQVRRGDRDDALEEFRRIDRLPSSHARPLMLQIWGEAMADADRFDGAGVLLETGRALARAGGLGALAAHLDALDGRVALASGDRAGAVEALRRARTDLDARGARWDVARIDLSLAEASLEDHPDDGRVLLDDATREFARVGSVLELDRARALRRRLD